MKWFTTKNKANRKKLVPLARNVKESMTKETSLRESAV